VHAAGSCGEEGRGGEASTHYLLVLGYEEVRGRRGSVSRVLLVKDPMEGDVLLRAQLECDVFNGGAMALTTLKPEGGLLDRVRPTEITHLGASQGGGGAAGQARVQECFA